ncbi:MAG: putative DNA binding domain-containing protein [candidate division KSB1 bacterium]|nr:putative DNA binding domain-containing protein [candidate division KSB1 bacterium]MDZ7305342.1 putative DNA binding domain-containing protein [candidate division KSB1 bacterium]MDZ7312029.1 putative DNA binding domain-containing protein [candidate division KSB1 bacterium]
MNLIELKTRIEQGENLHTEFKQWPVHPDDMAAAIVALANTDGGQIFIGVDNNGQIIGIDQTERDRISQSIDNLARNNLVPPVTIIQETVQDEQDRLVLVVHVPKGEQRPYRTNRGVYFVRTTSGRQQASREELLRLFQAAKSLYYDETPIVRSSSITDIELQARQDLLELARGRGVDVENIEPERLLHNWRLLREANGGSHLTLAGVLFLSRNPQYFLPTAYVSALRIPGTEIANEPLDQKRIEGRMLNIFEDTLRFLYIHLPRPHRIKGLEPEVQAEFPPEVLREILVNALAHRDYTMSAPIRVIVYDDRLEVRSPGLLPNTIKLESLVYGMHFLRNPIIYNMLLRIGLVTDAGSGIPRVIRLTRQAIGQEPVFRLEGNEFVVSLPRRGNDNEPRK